MNTLKEINIAASHLREILKEKMNPSFAFKRISLAKEFDSHLTTLQETYKGKELTKEEFEELLNTSVEIKNLIPKSEITFDISPNCLLAIEPFLID